jgi:hypothetical protein
VSLREGLKTALGHRINNTKGLLARPLYGSDVDPMIDAILDYLEGNSDEWADHRAIECSRNGTHTTCVHLTTRSEA